MDISCKSISIKMSPDIEVVRVTDRLADAIKTLFKVGGFALAFGFSGIIMMLSSNLIGGHLANWILLLGALLTFSCLGFFLYTTIQGNIRATKTLRDNKATVDTIQDISIELTRLANTIQAYSFKNISKINDTLNLVYPMIQSVPIIGDKAKRLGLLDASVISQGIVDHTEKTERIIQDIQSALINCDHKKLKIYYQELVDMVKSLKEQLKN